MNAIEFDMWKRRQAWKAFDALSDCLAWTCRVFPFEFYRKFEVKMFMKLMFWIIRHT